MKTTILTVATLCAVSSFGAIRAVTPTAWNGDPNCWQMQRHNGKMTVVTNGGAKVVFIGDSITHYWETDGRNQLAKYFGEGDFKMLDLGTGGTVPNTCCGVSLKARSWTAMRRKSFFS